MTGKTSNTSNYSFEYRRLSKAKAIYLLVVWGVGMVFLFPVCRNLSRQWDFWGLAIYGLIIAMSGFLVFGLTFNKVKLIFIQSYLFIKHAPLPWLGNKKIAMADIREVFLQEAKVATRGGSDICFQILAKLTDGTVAGLISEDLIYDKDKAEELVNLIKANLKP